MLQEWLACRSPLYGIVMVIGYYRIILIILILIDCTRHILILFYFSESISTYLCFQIGKTKVFLRAGQMAELDTRRTEVLGRSASIIQRKVRSYLARRSYAKLRLSAIRIQSACRGKGF